MTKRDYRRAAGIVRAHMLGASTPSQRRIATFIREAFIEFFTGDNSRFDVESFTKACEP